MPTSTDLIILAREGVYLRDFKKNKNSLGPEFTRLLETGNSKLLAMKKIGLFFAIYILLDESLYIFGRW